MKPLFRSLVIVVVVLGVVWLAAQLSPWPRALLVRQAFTHGGRAANDALARHVPPGVEEFLDVRYEPGDRDAYLDAYFPQAAADSARELPIVFWIHGGGWLAGSRKELANYGRILASYGYAVVLPDYSLAPASTYPRPVRQLATALRYVQANSARFHGDRMRVVLAGDSAGAQLAAQLASMIRDSTYAALVGIAPPIEPDHLRAALLFCGGYDLGLLRSDGPGRDFLHLVLWSYSGRRRFLDDPGFRSFSVRSFLSAGFPPCFITAGNADPLLPQSRAFAARAGELGIPVDSLFFAADHSPPLEHEYQFDLDTEAGRVALERATAFLAGRVAKSVP